VRLPLTAIYEFKNDRLLEHELDSTHANLYLRASMMHPGKLQDSIYQPSGLLDVDHDIVWGQQTSTSGQDVNGRASGHNAQRM